MPSPISDIHELVVVTLHQSTPNTHHSHRLIQRSVVVSTVTQDSTQTLVHCARTVI